MKLELDELCINTIRFLAVDAIQKANSGHPGLPLEQLKRFRQWGSITPGHPEP